MSFTRTRSTGSVTTPTRTQIQPGTSVDEDGTVKCPVRFLFLGRPSVCRRCEGCRAMIGHASHWLLDRRQRIQEGTLDDFIQGWMVLMIVVHRAFYTCPLGREDPNRCKFFKWADEIQASPQTGMSRAARLAASMNQAHGRTLGTTSSLARVEKPTTPMTQRIPAQPITPQTKTVVHEDEDGEIDWDKVDTNNLEREAIASTPGSSQMTIQEDSSQWAESFSDRLRDVTVDGRGKRKREDTTPRANASMGEVSRQLGPMIVTFYLSYLILR